PVCASYWSWIGNVSSACRANSVSRVLSRAVFDPPTPDTRSCAFKMAVYDVTMIPGDGIGPEVAEATRRVLEATGGQLNWDRRDIGMAALEKHADLIPQETLDSLRKNKIGIKGPTTTPI